MMLNLPSPFSLLRGHELRTGSDVPAVALVSRKQLEPSCHGETSITGMPSRGTARGFNVSDFGDTRRTLHRRRNIESLATASGAWRTPAHNLAVSRSWGEFFAGELLSAELAAPADTAALMEALSRLSIMSARCPDAGGDATLREAVDRAIQLHTAACRGSADLSTTAAVLRRAAAEVSRLGLRHATPRLTHLLATVARVLQNAGAPDGPVHIDAMHAMLQGCLATHENVPEPLAIAIREVASMSHSLRAEALALGHDGAASRKAGDEEMKSLLADLATVATPIWQACFAASDVRPDFNHIVPTRLGTNRVNHGLRQLKSAGHVASARVAALGTIVSPTMHNIRATNDAVVAEARARLAEGGARLPGDRLVAELDRPLMDDVRMQIAQTVRNAFTRNLQHTLQKAGGNIANGVRGLAGVEPHEVDRTRAEVIAKMLDLSEPASAINKAILEVGPHFERQGMPVSSMSKLQRNGLVMRLSTAVMDEACRPTAEEAERAAGIIERLAPELQKEIERIHLEGMTAVKAVMEGNGVSSGLTGLSATLRHPADREARMLAIVNDEIEKCSDRIAEASEKAFDQFRKEFGFEFGFNDTKTRLRENSGLEYYRHVLAYGPRWGAGFSLLGRALSLIDPTGAGRGLQLTTQAVSVFAGAFLSQAEAGVLGASSCDYKPFESAESLKGLYDAQLFQLERTHARAIQAMAVRAAAVYSDRGNAAHQACASRFTEMQRLGYGGERLESLAAHLSALCQLDMHLNPDRSIGIDDAVPPPVRISMLLHEHVQSLPNLNSMCISGKEITAFERDVVIKELVRAICAKAGKLDLDVDALVADVNAVARETERLAPFEGDSYRRTITPSPGMLATCGTEFGTVIKSMMETALRKEELLFSSKSVFSAQFEGLRRNAILTLVVQSVFAVGGVFAIGAATAAGGPAAGAGAGAAVTLGAAGATKVTRNMAAGVWARADQKGQTDFQLFKLMHPQHCSPFAGPEGKKRTHDSIVAAFARTHGPLYESRLAQLRFSLAAQLEDHCVKASEMQGRMGAQVLAAIESAHSGRSGTGIARLVGLSVEAERKVADAKKHRSVIDESVALARKVQSVADVASAQLTPQDPQEFGQLAQDHLARQASSWAMSRSAKYVSKNSSFVPDEHGVPAVHAQINAMRADAREHFDHYLAEHGTSREFHVSQYEWDGLKTTLRLSHADPDTEEWIARREADMLGNGILLPHDMRPMHVRILQMPGSSQLEAEWERRARKLEERGRLARMIVDDVLALDEGNYGAIKDPTGLVEKHLRSPVLAYETSKYARISGLADAAANRGFYRSLATLMPVTPLGAVTSLMQFAGLATQVMDAAGAFPRFRITGNPAFDKYDPSTGAKLPTSGFAPNLTGLNSTLLSNGMGAAQPSGTPAAFYAMNRNSFYGGFDRNHPAFWAFLEHATAGVAAHGLNTREWHEGLIPAARISSELTAGIGVNKQRSHAAVVAHRPGFEMSKVQRDAWSEARAQSKDSAAARLLDFLNPASVFRNMRYGKYARNHFDKTQLDRHRLASHFARISAVAAVPGVGKASDNAIDRAVIRSLVAAASGDRAVLAGVAEACGIRVRDRASTADIAGMLEDEAAVDSWARLALCNAAIDAMALQGAASHDVRAAQDLADKTLAQLEIDAATVLGERLRRCLSHARQRPQGLDFERLDRSAAKARSQLAQLTASRPVLANEYGPLLRELETELDRPISTRL